MRRRRSQFPKIVILLIAAGVFAAFMLIRGAATSPDKQARSVVDQFYHAEQRGDFALSWSLFHSEMKKKFNRSTYIQVRAHVFMNDFDVDTFTYKLGKPEKVKKWKMSKSGPALSDVYKVIVTQTFKGKFGNFDVRQDVYAAKEKGEWRVLWDYHQ